MGNTRGRHLHEGGFRPCSRCGRRTFSTYEDCGRYACPECCSVEIVRLSTRNVLYRMCARCRFEYSSPGPPRRVRWPVDGHLATDRGGRPSIAAAELRGLSRLTPPFPPVAFPHA